MPGLTEKQKTLPKFLQEKIMKSKTKKKTPLYMLLEKHKGKLRGS